MKGRKMTQPSKIQTQQRTDTKIPLTIQKRDGRIVDFDESKIVDAIEKSFTASGAMQNRQVAFEIADKVIAKINGGALEGVPSVEGVQDSHKLQSLTFFIVLKEAGSETLIHV